MTTKWMTALGIFAALGLTACSERTEGHLEQSGRSLGEQVQRQWELAGEQHRHFRPGYQRAAQRDRSRRADVPALTAAARSATRARSRP